MIRDSYSSEGYVKTFLAVLPIILALVIFNQQFLGLVEWWGSSSKYGHILVVFPYFVYMLYTNRAALARESKSIDLRVSPLYLLAIFTILVAQITSIDVIGQSALLGLVPVVIWMSMGFGVVWRIFFPLVLFLVTAPIWELITPVLTALTTDVVNLLLGQLGIPVQRNGSYLTIPAGTFEIAQGCGGYRYFIVGFTLGLMVAMENFYSLKGRLIAIAAAVFIALLGNWLRVIAVIVAGHLTDMQHPWVEEHVNLGWWIFAIVFLPFFIGARYFAETLPDTEFDEKHDKHVSERWLKKRESIASIVCYLVIVCSVSLLAHLALSSVTGQDEFSLAIDERESISIQGWQGPFDYYGNWQPHFEGAQYEKQSVYVLDDNIVTVYIVGYARQNPGKELVNVYSTFLNSQWRDYGTQIVDLSAEKSDIRLAKTDVGMATSRGAVWYWYNIGGHITPNSKIAKLLEISKLLSGDNYSLAVAINTRTPRSKQAQEDIENFISSYFLRFNALLRDAKRS